MEHNHLCILVNDFMRKDSMKLLLEFGSVVQDEMSFKKYLSGAPVALLLNGAKAFMQLWKRAS